MPQESILSDGTVRENVAYGTDDAGEESVRAALRDADALEFVDRLPRAWTHWSASGAPGCRADSASGSPSPAP